MIRVHHPSSDRHDLALTLFLTGRVDSDASDDIDAVSRAVTSNNFSLDGLLLAEDAGEQVGALLYVIQPDTTAYVWPPNVRMELTRRSDIAAVEDALVQEACRRIDDSNAWIAQTLLEPADTDARAVLARNGFRVLTEMLFMERSLSEAIPAPTRRLETTSFDTANASLFARLLEATYVQTRDCPELDGARSGAAALAGYREVGQFDPSLWKVYRSEDADVGVLLFNPHPEQGIWELTYMGIVPEARGHGHGQEMLKLALIEARRAGIPAIQLAVDDRNIFARRLYDAMGFVETSRRIAMTRMPRGVAAAK